MLYEVMRSIKYFPTNTGAIAGEYVVESGQITLPFCQTGQYFLVEGSVFNDGVYKYDGDIVLRDETFDGWITPLTLPPAFLELVSEIEDYVDNAGLPSQYQSESFDGYSYTRATNQNGDAYSWKDAFKGRLNQWRRL